MKSIHESIISILKERSLQKRLSVPVLMVAIAMVFAVAWSLHINGITLTSSDVVCGMEEHEHTDECYAWVVAETEGTEAVEATESTEENTVTQDAEDATEELTEELLNESTEETTESPQPGDTKVVNGVTHVYALVCGMEEHTHTDECYADIETESDTETGVAEADTNAAEEETDNSSPTAGASNSTFLLTTASTGEDEEVESEDTEYGIATVSDDESESESETETEEETESNSGISVASDEGISLTSSSDLGSVGATSSTYYYFADKVSASEALNNPGDYVVYTEINGNYYLVDGNGTLASLSNLVDSTSSYLSWYSDGSINNYKWALSESNSVNYLYNSSYGHYLSPSTTKSITGSSNSSGIYETLATIEDGQSIAVTVSGATQSVSSGYGLFYMRVYQESTGNYFYIRTAFGNNPVGKSGSGTLSSSVSSDTSNFGSGLTYIVIISRSGYDYAITVYDQTNDNIKLTATLTGSSIGDDALIQFSAGRCTYDLAVDVLESYGTSAVYTTTTSSDAVTVDNSSEGITIGSFQSTLADTNSFTGSFDITYNFTNKGNYGATDGYDYNWRNYVIKMTDSNGYEVFARADAYAWIHTNNDYTSGSTTSAVWDSGDAFSWDDWRSMMNAGVDMTVNVSWDNSSKTLKVVAAGGGATITTTFDLSSYGFASDGKVTLYLTGEYCNLSNITRTDNSVQSYSHDTITYKVSDSLYLMNYSTTAQGITITPSSGNAWTGSYTTSSGTVWNLFAELNSINAVEWITSDGSALTNSDASAYYDSGSRSVTIGSSVGTFQLYFAKIREFTAYFDGTNGGVYSSYRHSSYTANIQSTVQTFNMDSSGSYFYVDIPTVTLTDTAADGTTATNERANVTLAGWLDIYNAKYYELGTTITIPYDSSMDLTVCYADWIASNYNGGSASDSNYDSNVLDTSGFITTNVFDYNDLADTQSAYLASKAQSASEYVFGGSKETWLTSYTTGSNTAINNLFGSTGWGFMFIKAGGSALLNTTDRNNVLTDNNVSVNANNNDGATTGILSSTSTSATDLLAQLFGTTTEFTGKKYLGTGNYLYQYNELSGYYYFDSDLNAAFYNQDDSRFYLYNYKVALDDTSSDGDFFPFNYDEVQAAGVEKGGTTRLSASNIDYYFGMSSEITFYLPQDTGTVNANGSYGNQTVYDDYQNMVFKFSGDDDVWVVIDYGTSSEQLLLDIGGVHGQVYGEIDFSTGTVTVVNQPDATFTYTDTNGATQTETIVIYDENGVIGINENYLDGDLVSTKSLDEIIKSGSHTLTVFYTERGASQSNAAIYFNISPVYSLNMTKVDEDSEALEDVKFNIYKSSSFTEDNLVETVETDQYGKITINALVPQTTYYLVETLAADGYPLTSNYITIYVDTKGNATLTVYNRKGEVVESLSCDIGSSNSDSDNRYLIGSLSSTRTNDETFGNYVVVAFNYANYYEYELPSTGSMGIFPYRKAGAGLVIVAGLGLGIMAFYELVRVRRLRTAEYIKETQGKGLKRRKNRVRTRDHPLERSVVHGHARDRPEG